MSTARWNPNPDTDDVSCMDVSLEAARYRAYMIENGFDPEPQLVMGDGSILIKCDGHRTARFVRRRFINIEVNGSQLVRHV